MILPLLFGLMIGLTLGLLGGGSVLAVPALVYGLGQPVAQVVPTSLLVVRGSAAAGTIPNCGLGRCAGVWRWASPGQEWRRRWPVRRSTADFPPLSCWEGSR